jgi:hypothetical protein
LLGTNVLPEILYIKMADNELPLGAVQLMGWCRKVALMSREEFFLHYRVSLSNTAKRQLNTFPAINTGPRGIEFPWRSYGFVSNTQIQQERSPPLAHAIPEPLPVPAQNEQQDTQNTQNTIRIRRSRATEADSESSYEASRHRTKKLDDKEITNIVAQAPNASYITEIERVQNLLKTFATKLKYQRYHDNRMTSQQPSFETGDYREMAEEQETGEQELITKILLAVRENLALAFEATARSVHHHYIVAENLSRLQEILDKPQLRETLLELQMSRR